MKFKKDGTCSKSVKKFLWPYASHDWGSSIRWTINGHLEDLRFESITVKYKQSYYGSLHISDCRKTITLELDLDTPKDRDDTRKKLNRLIKEVQGLVDEIDQLQYDICDKEGKK